MGRHSPSVDPCDDYRLRRRKCELLSVRDVPDRWALPQGGGALYSGAPRLIICAGSRNKNFQTSSRRRPIAAVTTSFCRGIGMSGRFRGRATALLAGAALCSSVLVQESGGP